MRQDAALKILAQNKGALKDEFGVAKLGVFPWDDGPGGCECRPRAEIGVAVEYKPEVRTGLEFFALKSRIEELLGCGVILTSLDGHYDPIWEHREPFLSDVVYAG